MDAAVTLHPGKLCKPFKSWFNMLQLHSSHSTTSERVLLTEYYAMLRYSQDSRSDMGQLNAVEVLNISKSYQSVNECTQKLMMTERSVDMSHSTWAWLE